MGMFGRMIRGSQAAEPAPADGQKFPWGRFLIGGMDAVDAERAKAARDAWLANAPPGLFGGQAAVAQAAPEPDPMTDPQGAMAAGLGRAVNGAPPPAAPPAAPTMQDVLPWLAQGALAGYDGVGTIGTLIHEAQPGAPKIVEGPDGIYRQKPGGSGFELVQPYRQPAPAGWRYKEDGTLEYVPNGPADPAYIAKTAGVRRAAVVSKPMPTRPRAPKAVNPNAIKWD